MSPLQKRILLFLVGCMGTRSLFVYIAKQAQTNRNLLQFLGFLALVPTIGFLYIYASGSRKTGPEVFGDTIWWNSLRPIHGLLYGAFAISAISGYTNAWYFLLADLLLGFTSFVLFHSMNGDFMRLLRG
jgi:hypothetical protein